MALFVVNQINLGKRVGGYTCYDSKSKEFNEYTPKEVKNLIKSGGVYGLKLEGDEIALDRAGFHTENLMVKSGIGNYKPLNPAGNLVNTFYAVVKVIHSKDGIHYEVVSDKAARIELTEERLKIFLEFGCVSGVYFGENKAIKTCTGVEVENDPVQQGNKMIDKKS